jgi:hypothetical protein
MDGLIGGLRNAGKRPIAQNGQKGFTRRGSNVTGGKRKGLKNPLPKKKNALGPGKKNGFPKKKGDPKKNRGPKKNEVLKKKLWSKKNPCGKKARWEKPKPRKPNPRSPNPVPTDGWPNVVSTPNRGLAKAELLNAAPPNRELPSAVFPNRESEKPKLSNRTLPNFELAKAELSIAELPKVERRNRESPNGVLPKCEFSKFDRTRLGGIADPIALGAFAVRGEVVLMAEEGVVGLELSAHMSRPCPDQLFVADPVASDPVLNERFEPALKLGGCVFAAIAPPAAGPEAPGVLATEALPAFPNECH